MIPANPKEMYEEKIRKVFIRKGFYTYPEWEMLPQDAREYYILEYDKLFVYNQPASGGCGDTEVPPS